MAEQLAIDDPELEAELLAHLVPPLQLQEAGQTTSAVRARWRKKKLLYDKPRLDRLAEADVVGNQQVVRGIRNARTTGSSW